MATKNPINPDKVAKQPSLLPYAHHIGSAIIQPLDKGKVKGLAMAAMFEQTEDKLQQIKEQVDLLIRQAQEIHDRIDVSESIYQAECGFEPIIGRTYFLYERKSGKKVLSMISEAEWGKSIPYTYNATVKLLSDHTWEIIHLPE